MLPRTPAKVRRGWEGFLHPPCSPRLSLTRRGGGGGNPSCPCPPHPVPPPAIPATAPGSLRGGGSSGGGFGSSSAARSLSLGSEAAGRALSHLPTQPAGPLPSSLTHKPVWPPPELSFFQMVLWWPNSSSGGDASCRATGGGAVRWDRTSKVTLVRPSSPAGPPGAPRDNVPPSPEAP